MKILIASDFHGSSQASHRTASKARTDEVDMIIVCGDITHFGSVKDAKEVLEPLTALEMPVLYVPGNCDTPKLARAQIDGAINLHRKCTIQNNILFMGLGGAPLSQFHTPFELPESKITEILKEGLKQCLPSKWFAIVSHATPRNTKVDTTFSNHHVGSVSLRRFIEQEKPHIVFGGHIHEARGVDLVGETLIVNPGSARHGNCATADINEKIVPELDYL